MYDNFTLKYDNFHKLVRRFRFLYLATLVSSYWIEFKERAFSLPTFELRAAANFLGSSPTVINRLREINIRSRRDAAKEQRNMLSTSAYIELIAVDSLAFATG
ncbi:hypothetical protein ANN_19472 [Periplaneta americana]|uniref:Uncharacterized protein n=1 Tax=Periplaneta americana TaxID=6978 RepID=A0ABQ8SB36_PERAM|nr:hypothetical protein ANN_19472 [Periplaneta americana]